MLGIFVLIAIVLKAIQRFKVHKRAGEGWNKLRRGSLGSHLKDDASGSGGGDSTDDGISPRLAKSVFATRNASAARRATLEARKSPIHVLPPTRGTHGNKVAPSKPAKIGGGMAWDLSQVIESAVSDSDRQ